MKARRYNDAADEYRELAIHASPDDRPAAVLPSPMLCIAAAAIARRGPNYDLPGDTPIRVRSGSISWAKSLGPSDENDAFYQRSISSAHDCPDESVA